MATRHLSPTAQWKEPGSGAALLTELVLRETAANVFEMDDEGTADAVFVIDETTAPPTVQIDDDLSAAGALRIWIYGDNVYLSD